MPDSIDFYKGIFLHAILVRIIVPWYKERRYRKRNRTKMSDSIMNNPITMHVNKDLLTNTFHVADEVFFLSGFSFTSIHDLQDSKGRRRLSF